MRHTKIVATVGPASAAPETLDRLMEAGVDVFRLNASHGTVEERAARIAQIQAVAARRNARPGILLDLQGPKIRLGRFEGGSASLEAGARFTITTQDCLGNASIASTTYGDFARDVKPGSRVLLADGAVELRALRSDGVAVECEVVHGGLVSDRKGINLPGVPVSTPAMTKKDTADLRAALQCGIDMVALSFVRHRDDLLRLRHLLDEHDANLPIIAKIEKPEGWQRLGDILEEANGVMVARGDLGVEMAIEKVPFIQKSIIEKARARGRFVITATQMLESMIENPTPTRAEVSDIANAIYDGTDAVMLSAETSTGKYPVEAVSMMARVACEAEASLRSGQGWELPADRPPTPPEMVADAAYRAARRLNAAAIVVFTTSGTAARLVARFRSSVPVCAFTPSEAVARQLSVIYGVRSVGTEMVPATDEMMTQMDRMLIDLKWARQGDLVICVSGQPVGLPGTTNMMKVHTVS